MPKQSLEVLLHPCQCDDSPCTCPSKSWQSSLHSIAMLYHVFAGYRSNFRNSDTYEELTQCGHS